jgi:prolyl-tRNA synthetase
MASQSLKTKSDVLSFLQAQHIAFKEYLHKPALTIEDLRIDPGKLDKSPFVKNLVYVDKKKAFHFLLAHENTQVSKPFWKTIGSSYNNVRMATPEQLQDTLGTFKGAVNVFSVLNDADKKVVKVYLDSKLQKEQYLSFHPQDNTSTVELKTEDVLNLLAKHGKELVVADMEVGEAAVESEGKQDDKDKEGKAKEAKAKDDSDTKLKIEFGKTEHFGNWYADVIFKADMIDYYDVSGCYILKPNAFFVWEQVQSHLDKAFKKQSVKNVYFPMFVRKKHLESEKDHLEGFSAEVAWVTHSGKSPLAEPIAIRPTSETIMYPSFAKWIQSHRDLPLKINQWTNVVRWEFKHPTPFIRTREFLWQEGHTAHATKQEADKMVFDILDVYESCYRELLAIPVIKGVKSENEKFAGADYTSTCETFIAENGRAIQACTSHSLGQNFAKIFNIEFEDTEMKKQMAHQTSWGFTTRSIGITVMVHADDKGMVYPPKVAPLQVIVVPILFKDKNKEGVLQRCGELVQALKEHGIRADFDDRPNYTAGWKFNDWELKGVPLRLELGPKDFELNEVKVVRRVDEFKVQVGIKDIVKAVEEQMEQAHNIMYNNAYEKLHNNIMVAGTWNEFMAHLNNMKVVKTPWCQGRECEEKVKERSGVESKLTKNEEQTMSGSAKTLCMPLKQESLAEGTRCFHCGAVASKWVLWGRSY